MPRTAAPNGSTPGNRAPAARAAASQRRIRCGGFSPPTSSATRPTTGWISPPLSKLIRDTPANQLGDRFPGKQIGTIGDSALTGPDALVIVTGHSASQLSHAHYATEVTSIETPAAAAGGTAGVENSATLRYIFIAAACALLFPVLTFIGTATPLAAARREPRFAA